MAVNGARVQIQDEVLTWPGVEARPHRFGGTEFRLGRREIGHIHGDSLLDVPFPKRVRDQLLAEGRAQPHHILPDTGWVSLHLREPSDITRAIDLLRHSYRLAVEQRNRPEMNQ